ncbi:MAG: substrate-binding domain-containing protein [Sphaerochaeta sp.]
MRNSPDNTDSVIVDNTQGAEKAVDFLVEQGHREIYFVAGSDTLELYQERFSGYKKSLEKHGIPYSEDLVWPGFHGTNRIISQVAKERLESGVRPKAIFCASDPLAIDLLKTLHDCKVSVPEQVSVIGFDNLKVSEIFYPSLTTIEQPFFEMGKAAVKLLVEQIENPNKRSEPNLIFDTKVIVRESVKSVEM